MTTSSIYLDNNATTPLWPNLKQVLSKSLTSDDATNLWGNPSSIHQAGQKAKRVMRETRAVVAEQFKCHPLEIIFTSGASESNTTAIMSVWNLIQQNKNNSRSEFITSEVEHPSLTRLFKHLQTLGAVVHYLPVNRQGAMDLDRYAKVLSEKTALVSVMFANNETGNLFPIQDMVKQAHSKGALFHSDCVQSLGKHAFDLETLSVDYASFSAHKFYSLKGLGLLFVRKKSPLDPLIFGGGQERHRRGGTENVIGILSLGYVLGELKDKIPAEITRVRNLRDYLENEILKTIPQSSVTGQQAPRLPNTSSLVIPGVDGETLLMNLDMKGFAVSTGAACSSGNPEPSPVLLNMGLSRAEAQNSLRLSLGYQNTKEEIDLFVSTLKTTVEYLRGLT